jgi:hypothetical protein
VNEVARHRFILKRGPGSSCGNGTYEIIVDFVEQPIIEKILTHQGLNPHPPSRRRARDAGQD